CMQGTQLPPTF
nr:immunoglobulin light chain junction region [Macaca mulatta]MOW42546.1 immunoglobulin light chain junction region [Macaca mulatta]MOW42800.1 immunoglobulin light chain junction region [Macaca mulatta]MOW42956.1 immunoglobulin light chain junction region [Macaca mulatta]MOW44241.1 immunoglobulin light chain junction region [Macaca mulatta]